jgi:hypothetical protein
MTDNIYKKYKFLNNKKSDTGYVYSLKKDIKNVPVSVIERNFKEVSQNMKLVNYKIDMLKYLRYRGEDDESLLTVTLTRRHKDVYQLKITGLTNINKGFFTFQIVKEILSVYPYCFNIEESKYKIINTIITWFVPKKKIHDFQVLSRELKDMCKFYVTIFPQAILFNSAKNQNCKNKLTCNISTNGKATSAGIKDLKKIPVIKKFMNDTLNLLDQNSTEEKFTINNNFSVVEDKYRRNEIQNLDCFICDKKTKSNKSFNISSIKLPNRRYLTSISSPFKIKKGVYRSLVFFIRNVRNFTRIYGKSKHQLYNFFKIRKPFNL